MAAARNATMAPAAKAPPAPGSLQLPAKIHDAVPESRLYTQLQTFEHRVDAFITRKRLDLLEQRQRLRPVQRTLRVFVSSTAADQYVTDASTKTGVPADALGPTPPAATVAGGVAGADNAADQPQRALPSWTLHLKGRLLDPVNSSKKQQQPQPKFTTFLKSVVVSLDQDQGSHPDGNIIEWTKKDHEQPSDSVEIKRIGDTNVAVKIMLFLDTPTQKFKLSAVLAKFLNIHTDTLNTVISAVWQYIKQNKLQDPDDKRIVICDKKLMDVFGRDRFSFAQLPSLLAMHFLPADPVVIDYTIRTDSAHDVSKHSYDIDVEIPNPLKDNLDTLLLSHFGSYSNVYEHTFGRSPNQSSQLQEQQQHASLVKEIQSIDRSISEGIQDLIKTQSKVDFLSSFVEDPVTFLHKYCEGQSREASAILGDATSNSEASRRAQTYQTDSVKEAVFQYLETR